MAGRWRITSHPTGEWIIQAGRARCAVVPELGRALLPLDGQVPDAQAICRQLDAAAGHAGAGHAGAGHAGAGHAGAGPAGSGPASEGQTGAGPASEGLARELARILGDGGDGRPEPGGRAIWLRLPLVPARVTAGAARRLAPLAATTVLAAMTVIGAGLYTVGWQRGHLVRPEGAPAVAAALGLFLLLGLWHELGHAAALRREGYLPGGIGLGILFVIPVLYADVSAVAALPRSGKLRVDLAGVCFQLAGGGLLFAAGALNPQLAAGPALQWAGLLVLPVISWSLLPFIRADGYWFLADLLNLPDLDRPAPAGRSRRLRLFLVLHRGANLVFLVLVGVMMPFRLYGYLAWAAAQVGVPLPVVQVAAAALALAAWWGLVRRLLFLWAACRADLLGPGGGAVTPPASPRGEAGGTPNTG